MNLSLPAGLSWRIAPRPSPTATRLPLPAGRLPWPGSGEGRIDGARGRRGERATGGGGGWRLVRARVGWIGLHSQIIEPATGRNGETATGTSPRRRFAPSPIRRFGFSSESVHTALWITRGPLVPVARNRWPNER